jgi:hypothetical protein
MYKAIQLVNHSVITKDNKICGDRDIQKRNKFHYFAEAAELADYLNDLIKNGSKK